VSPSNLSDITSKLRTVAMFESVIFLTVFLSYVGILFVYLCTRFHFPSSNGSLLIAIKLEDEGEFLSAVRHYFNILQETITFHNVARVWKKYYRTPQQRSNGASVIPKSYCGI
jgi:hypothetical protein